VYVAWHDARCKPLCVIVTVEFVTLSTQTIWLVTSSKYTNNCHCTFKLYDYCPVGANNSL